MKVRIQSCTRTRAAIDLTSGFAFVDGCAALRVMIDLNEPRTSVDGELYLVIWQSRYIAVNLQEWSKSSQ